MDLAGVTITGRNAAKDRAVLDASLQGALDKLGKYSFNGALGDLNGFLGKLTGLRNTSPPRISYQDSELLAADVKDAARCIQALGDSGRGGHRDDRDSGLKGRDHR